MSERPSDEATNDAAVASEDAGERAYRVKLPMFEGPLDLLLHLIQKHELNILDIPIGFVAQKYVEYIRLMEEMSIDIASEYLVMAATLAHLKSRSLLPPDPTQESEEASEEEEEDPRAELIRRLLEYQKYKHAADNLGQREVLGRDVFQRGLAPEQSDEEAPLAPMSLFKLVDAFENVLKRARQVQEHHIDFEKVSITDRIGQIVERLRAVGTLQFEQLFEGDVTRAEMIVTFLALLEMTKLRMTRLAQEGPLAPIVIELVLTADQARNFHAERAFEQVMEAVEHDFAAEKPRLDGPRTNEPLPAWEAEALDLDQLSDEELAEELREAAQAFSLVEDEARAIPGSPREVSSAGSIPSDPDEPWFTFGPPVEDDFADDDDVETVAAEASFGLAHGTDAVEENAALDAELQSEPNGEALSGFRVDEPLVRDSADAELSGDDEEPFGEEPIGEEPIGEEPIGEEPIGEEPIGEEPIGEEPIGEEPTGEEPIGEEPTGEEPIGEEPIDEEPIGEEPIGEELTDEKPLGDETETFEQSRGDNAPTPGEPTDARAPAPDGPRAGADEVAVAIPADGFSGDDDVSEESFAPASHEDLAPAREEAGSDFSERVPERADGAPTPIDFDESSEPQLQNEGSEPETKEENERVREGSQDPDGSDVESR